MRAFRSHGKAVDSSSSAVQANTKVSDRAKGAVLHRETPVLADGLTLRKSSSSGTGACVEVVAGFT